MTEPGWSDVLWVLLAFFGLISPGLGWIAIRELRRIREERERDRLEAEAMAAEGFPPPDPPTTDSQPPKR